MKNIFLDMKVKYQENYILVANYLLIIYAFFLPIHGKPVKTIFVIVLFLFLISGNLKEKLIFAIKDNVVQSILLFFIVHFVWMIGSDNLDSAIFKSKELKHLLYIIIFIVVIRKDFVQKILFGFLLGVFFSEIVSFLMYFDIIIPYLPYTETTPYVPFMTSYTQHSIIIAISLSLLLYKILFKQETMLLKIFYILFFMAGIINLLMVQSKLGYGLFSMSILIVIIYFTIKKKKYILFPLSLIAIMGVYALLYNLNEPFQNRIVGMVEQTNATIKKQEYQGSLGVRIGFYVYGYDLIKDNFLFGVGSGDHIDEFNTYVRKHEQNLQNLQGFYQNTSNGFYASLHSEFLDNYIQFGVIGLLAFLNIFYQLIKYKKKDEFSKVIQLIIVVVFLSVSSVSLIFLYAKLKNIFIFLIVLTLKQYYDDKRLKLIR